jgi:tRNA U34 5-methylaminomethyl-2-thiouridine-forming methyltransferase MnmC
MKIQITADGSHTAFCSIYNESCHSQEGAYSETDYIYIQGCEINSAQNKNTEINILEMGFGLGHGLAATLKAIPDRPFTFLSFEKNMDVIEIAKSEHSFLEKLQPSQFCDLKVLSLKINKAQLYIILGDARENLAHLSTHKNAPKIHAIFQDAFSPKRNPRLWTVNWFEDLKKISHQDVILSTYSASSSVRKSLVTAGWKVQNRKGFAKKRSATIAKLFGESEQEVIDHLERSPVYPTYDEIKTESTLTL